MRKHHGFRAIKPLIFILFGSFTGALAAAPGNPIPFENQKPGSEDWQLPLQANLDADPDAGGEPVISGYVDQPSVNVGEDLGFKISVDPPQDYRIDIYRMGYYGGTGGRRVHAVPARAGITQASCPMNTTTGMVECRWNNSYKLHVPDDWISGIFMAVLVTEDNHYHRIPFVVRNDSRLADFMYQQSAFAYQAFNCYPCQSYGKSLYDESSSASIPTVAGSPRAVKVSMDRPLDRQVSHASRSDTDFLWELYLVQWLEKEGYDVNYSTDIDTHIHGSRLMAYKGFISGGRDAYWTTNMFNAIERARDHGLNLAFFGAGTAYWQMRLEPASNGSSNRVITCYKDAQLDPTKELRKKTIPWRELGRPEQTLIGVQYATRLATISEEIPLVMKVFEPKGASGSLSWLLNDTDPAMQTFTNDVENVGIDRRSTDYPPPNSRADIVLAQFPYVTTDHRLEYSETSLYQAPSGAWVFGAGSLSWSWSLSRPGFVNPFLQQITRNILNQMLQTNRATYWYERS